MKSGRSVTSGLLSQNNPFDLVERDLVIAAIVKFGRARALVRGHLLRVLDRGIRGRARTVEICVSAGRNRGGAHHVPQPGRALPAGCFSGRLFRSGRHEISALSRGRPGRLHRYRQQAGFSRRILWRDARRERRRTARPDYLRNLTATHPARRYAGSHRRPRLIGREVDSSPRRRLIG